MTKDNLQERYPDIWEEDARQRATLVDMVYNLWDAYEITPSALRELYDAVELPENGGLNPLGPYTFTELRKIDYTLADVIGCIRVYPCGFGYPVTPGKTYEMPKPYAELLATIWKYRDFLEILRSYALCVCTVDDETDAEIEKNADAARVIVGKLADASAN